MVLMWGTNHALDLPGLTGSSNEKCIRLLYNLIKLPKINMFDVLMERFDCAVF